MRKINTNVKTDNIEEAIDKLYDLLAFDPHWNEVTIKARAEVLSIHRRLRALHNRMITLSTGG